MLTLIVNPVAGHGFALATAQKMTQELQNRGIAYRLLQTERAGHARELARQALDDPECQAVLSVGGDGTSFEVAETLMRSGTPMAVIPAGTGNDFIKSLGLPKDPMQVLDFVLTHEPRKLDVARINDRIFLNVSGLGFDVTVLEQTASLKHLSRGILPYLLGLIRTLFIHKPVPVRYTLNGVEHEENVLLLSVANGRYIGGGIPICPAAQVDDGLLDLVLVHSVSRLKTLKYLPGLMKGNILKFDVTEHTRCTQLSVVSPGMKVQVDGEIFTMDRADFAVEAGALNFYW